MGGILDIFVVCDMSFMDVVNDCFGECMEFFRNLFVIIVEFGNFYLIEMFEDFICEGFWIGFLYFEKFVLGVFMKCFFEDEGLWLRICLSGNWVLDVL